MENIAKREREFIKERSALLNGAVQQPEFVPLLPGPAPIEESVQWAAGFNLALDWADRAEAHQHDLRGYTRSYSAGLFTAYVRLESESTVRAGAHAVYGWMPTILAKFGDYPAFAAFVEPLLLAPSPQACAELLTPSAQLRYVNGSVAGNSKLLHFLAPDRLPTWDSRVARVFGLTRREQFDRPECYVAYVRQLGAWLESDGHRLPRAYRDFLRAGTGPTLRAVEFAPFLARAIGNGGRQPAGDIVN